MGKILKALKTANGDISDLVMHCLEEVPDSSSGSEERHALRGRPASAGVLEPVFDKATVVSLPPREEDLADAAESWPEEVEAPLPGLSGTGTANGPRTISLRVSDATPLLSPGSEDRRAAEQYRIIRTRIFHQRPQSSITVIS